MKSLFPRLRGADPTTVMAQLLQMSLHEWLTWLSAEDRPLSITDQNTKRVLALYQAIFPADVPDAELLYNDLKLPLGQARYIAQAISYQRGTYLQTLALKSTLRALHSAVVVWQALPQDERDNQERLLIKFPASSEKAYLEAVKSLALDGAIAFPVRKERIYDFVTYLVETAEWKKVARALILCLEAIDRNAAEVLNAECPTLREALQIE